MGYGIFNQREQYELRYRGSEGDGIEYCGLQCGESRREKVNVKDELCFGGFNNRLRFLNWFLNI